MLVLAGRKYYQQMQKQNMVTGGNLGGSGTDLAAKMSLIHNLLSQKAEALHLLLINQHFLLPALVKHKINHFQSLFHCFYLYVFIFV